MKKIVMIFGVIFLLIFIIIFVIDFYVRLSTKNQILKIEDISSIDDIDCILVLGAGIWGNKPSHMLEDRLLQAINLYEQNVAPKIIMSGDHSRKDYDEVNLMKQFAIDKKVASEDIFMDHAGFSSYDSIYRAKEIFGAKKIIIITQKYHLYRSLYIANSLGVESYGVEADLREYQHQTYRELREILARNKDFIQCIFKPEPQFLGDKISLSGSRRCYK